MDELPVQIRPGFPTSQEIAVESVLIVTAFSQQRHVRLESPTDVVQSTVGPLVPLLPHCGRMPAMIHLSRVAEIAEQPVVSRVDEDVGGFDVVVAVALIMEFIQVLEDSVKRASIDPVNLFSCSGFLVNSFGQVGHGATGDEWRYNGPRPHVLRLVGIAEDEVIVNRYKGCLICDVCHS